MQDDDTRSELTTEPGPDSGAISFGGQNLAETEGVVNYFFPVEIVVAGSLAPREREIIQAQIYQDLHDAIVRRLA